MDKNTEKREYSNAVLGNLFSLQKKCELVTVPIILLPFIYFLISESFIEYIDFGFLKIEKIKANLILVLIPLFYSLAIIGYVITSFNRYQLELDYKKIFNELTFEKDEQLRKKMIYNTLPFNIWLSLSALTEKKTCINKIISITMIPLISVLFLPLWFSCYSWIRICTEFWDISFFSKVSFFITMWIWLVIGFLMAKLFIDKWNGKYSKKNR